MRRRRRGGKHVCPPPLPPRREGASGPSEGRRHGRHTDTHHVRHMNAYGLFLGIAVSEEEGRSEVTVYSR